MFSHCIDLCPAPYSWSLLAPHPAPTPEIRWAIPPWHMAALPLSSTGAAASTRITEYGALGGTGKVTKGADAAVVWWFNTGSI